MSGSKQLLWIAGLVSQKRNAGFLLRARRTNSVQFSLRHCIIPFEAFGCAEIRKCLQKVNFRELRYKISRKTSQICQNRSAKLQVQFSK